MGEPLDERPETLRGWIERVGIDAGQRRGVPSPTETRIRELEREVGELRRSSEILKAASAFTLDGAVHSGVFRGRSSTAKVR